VGVNEHTAVRAPNVDQPNRLILALTRHPTRPPNRSVAKEVSDFETAPRKILECHVGMSLDRPSILAEAADG
jgi:hypothetical protein